MPRKKTLPKRKIRVGEKITTGGDNPLDQLTAQKRAFVGARAEGRSIQASSAIAGVSNVTGGRYERDDIVQAAYRQLLREALPMGEMVDLINGGAHATIPVYDLKGRKKSDRPDWKTRKGYIEMAREDAGYVEKQSGGSGTAIQVIVTHVGSNGQSLKTDTDNGIPRLTTGTPA